MTAGLPQTGVTYRVGAACGVPHGSRPITFTVTHIDQRPGWDGMTWLHGYELHPDTGAALEHRRIYVITAGLQPITPPPLLTPAARRRAANSGPARIPRQRVQTTTTTGGIR